MRNWCHKEKNSPDFYFQKCITVCFHNCSKYFKGNFFLFVSPISSYFWFLYLRFVWADTSRTSSIRGQNLKKQGRLKVVLRFLIKKRVVKSKRRKLKYLFYRYKITIKRWFLPLVFTQKPYENEPNKIYRGYWPRLWILDWWKNFGFIMSNVQEIQPSFGYVF